MNRNLQKRILEIREALETDPRGILVGSLPAPAQNVERLSGLPSDYLELLNISDGIQCGEVVFYALDALDQFQPLADLIPGGRERWLNIGHLPDQAIALDRNTGELKLINIRCGDSDGITYERLDRFLESVFGQEYLTLAGYQDDWYRLLLRLGFAVAT